jgi:hypothetical protein
MRRECIRTNSENASGLPRRALVISGPSAWVNSVLLFMVSPSLLSFCASRNPTILDGGNMPSGPRNLASPPRGLPFRAGKETLSAFSDSVQFRSMMFTKLQGPEPKLSKVICWSFSTLNLPPTIRLPSLFFGSAFRLISMADKS